MKSSGAVKVLAPNYPNPTELTLVCGQHSSRQPLCRGGDYYVNNRGKLIGPMSEADIREKYKPSDFQAQARSRVRASAPAGTLL